MRTSRKLYLPQSGGASVHKIWRAHNKEFLLSDPRIRDLYLTQINHALTHKSVDGNLKIHAYCIMSNHSHQIISYQNSSKDLSSFMRIAHCNFGQKFNRIRNRQGSVAYDRPKTPLIQTNDYHQMRVHFYIEANPLRAGMVKNLKLYAHSSYRYYAYGVKDSFSKILTPPQWYINLGPSPKIRQKKYRELFDKYLKEVNKRLPIYTKQKFIGDIIWIHFKTAEFKKVIQSLKIDHFKPPNIAH